jgi:methionyl-tRNA formyltransferase
MKMDAGLDTGPILKQSEPVAIKPDETRERLEERLAQLGAELLMKTLDAYLGGSLQPRLQPEEGVTYARQLRKEDGLLDWSRPAAELGRRVRACNLWPGAYTFWQGQQLKILQAAPQPLWRGEAPPGTIVALADGVVVATGEGALRLEQVQLAGKRPMDIAAFLCGQRECVGSQFGFTEGQ